MANINTLDLDAAIMPGSSASTRSSQVTVAIAYWNGIIASAAAPNDVAYANAAINLLNLEQLRLNDPLSHPDAQV